MRMKWSRYYVGSSAKSGLSGDDEAAADEFGLLTGISPMMCDRSTMFKHEFPVLLTENRISA